MLNALRILADFWLILMGFRVDWRTADGARLCFQGPARDDRGGEDWPRPKPQPSSRDARVARVVLILSVVTMLMPFSLTTCVDMVRYAAQ